MFIAGYLVDYINHLLTLSFSGDLIDDSTLMKAIKGLNETVGVVLEYLQDAKVMIVILVY